MWYNSSNGSGSSEGNENNNPSNGMVRQNRGPIIRYDREELVRLGNNFLYDELLYSQNRPSTTTLADNRNVDTNARRAEGDENAIATEVNTNVATDYTTGNVNRPVTDDADAENIARTGIGAHGLNTNAIAQTSTSTSGGNVSESFTGITTADVRCDSGPGLLQTTERTNPESYDPTTSNSGEFIGEDGIWQSWNDMYGALNGIQHNYGRDWQPARNYTETVTTDTLYNNSPDIFVPNVNAMTEEQQIALAVQMSMQTASPQIIGQQLCGLASDENVQETEVTADPIREVAGEEDDEHKKSE